MNMQELGFTKEEIIEAIAAKVLRELRESGTDPDEMAESEIDRVYQKLREARTQAIEKGLAAAVAKVCAEITNESVGQHLETMKFETTTAYGEKKEAAKSLREYIHHTIEKWMAADVNSKGESQYEMDRSYDFRSAGKRIPVMIHRYIREDVETATKKALEGLSNAISGGLAAMVRQVVNDKLAKVMITVP